MTTRPPTSAPAAGSPAAAGDPSVRFPCSRSGALARGRWRLGWLLGGAAAVMLATAAAAWAAGRFWPGLLAALVALVPLMALRMSGDLDLLGLDVDPGALVLLLRSGRDRVPLDGASARRLTDEEIRHLAGLASRGGVVAGSGGYESHLLGEIELFATDLGHAVLVETEDRRLVVTPDDPEIFLEALTAAASGPSRTATILSP